MIYLFLPLILGVVAVVLVPALLRAVASADPAALARFVRLIGGGALLLAAGLLTVAGAMVLAGPLSLLALWLLRQGRGQRWGDGGRARRSGQSSTVRTARLEATLDHDRGEIDAEVLAGRHEGRRFSGMSDAEILDVWHDCAGDQESRLIVEAYLDRRRPHWREDVDADGDLGTGGAARSGAMTVEDAYEVLGLQPGASEAEIRASHRRLMKQMHPDQGGSTFFAAKLNEAKDILLRKR